MFVLMFYSHGNLEKNYICGGRFYVSDSNTSTRAIFNSLSHRAKWERFSFRGT